MVVLHIKLNGIHEMQGHGSEYFSHRHPHAPDPRGMGSIGQKSTFSEHGHVAYQIKGNHEFSNMEANILHAYPLPHDPRGWGQFHDHRVWGQNSTLSEYGHVA